jgi:glycosyltransferase involved in cell wall biosynthesis
MSRKKAYKAYRDLNAVVGVSESVSDAFSKCTGIEHNIYTLYNTNDTERIVRMSSEKSEMNFNHDCPIICSSGRLTKQKGFDRLIDVAHRLWKDGYRFQVLIMGSGPEEGNLRTQIQRTHSDGYVKLFGFCENPYNIMAQADIYVLPSREEGLATVLTEALTLGMPIASTDVSGAREVLGEHGEYGLIVENSEQGIYEGMKLFLTERAQVDYYKSHAKERAELFNTEHTVAKTEAFLESILQK